MELAGRTWIRRGAARPAGRAVHAWGAAERITRPRPARLAGHPRTRKPGPHSWLVRLSRPARLPRLARHPWTRADVGKDELPLVVLVPALVKPNGLFLALAGDADDARSNGGLLLPRPARLSERGHGWRHRRPQRRLTLSGPLPSLLARRLGRARLLLCAGRDNSKLAVLHHRIFVLLPKEALGNQEVDGRRQRAGVLPLEQIDGPDVLLAAKHELRLALALHFVSPDRHGDREHDGQHRDRDEERGHGVSFMADPFRRLTS
jgi:hypothetical protein